MSETTTARPEQKVYPAEVQTILQRGNAGDPAVLPQLRRVLDENPELRHRLEAEGKWPLKR